jgi:hypothetical protein
MISNADDTQTLKGGKDGQVDRAGLAHVPQALKSSSKLFKFSLSDDETLVYGNCFSYLHLSYGAFNIVTASYVASTN